jgi:hypothetical protein
MQDIDAVLKIMPLAFTVLIGSGVVAFIIWKAADIIASPKEKKLEVITNSHRKFFNLK